jgi:hypothetical protein
MTITSPVQVTPAWLTQVLRERQALTAGQVLSVEVEELGAFVSAPARLRLTYSPEATGPRPESLFIKFSRRANEVNFYRHILPRMPDSPNLIRAYAAGYSDEAQMGYILLDDLSATHRELEDDGGMPDDRMVEEVVKALAWFHAFWWDAPELQGEVGDIAEDIYEYIFGVARENYDGFVQAAGEDLPREGQEMYRRLLSDWPFPAWEERFKQSHLTLVHGDTHFYNVFFPRDPENRTIKLVDWAVWHINLGASDMAYQIVFSPPAWRQAHELPLLKKYYRYLSEFGVEGYSWEACWYDYRLSSLAHLLWPPFWQAVGLPEGIWRKTLEDGWRAYQDLGLAEFLP